MSQTTIIRLRLWIAPLLVALSILALPTKTICAADWPQILGPNRNAVADEQIGSSFPSAGPKVVWSAPIGQGFAGPVVVGEQVLIFHRVDNQERLESLNTKTGKSTWKAEFPARYKGGYNPDLGPRATPVVVRDQVFLSGASGDCHAVNLKTGKPMWSRDLASDYDSIDSYFGAASTPILVADTLLVNNGGKKAGIVGLDMLSGKTKWATTKEIASYSSPIHLAGKTPSALFITRLNVVKVEAATGSTKTLLPFGKSGPTVNAASPLWIDDKLFLTASYGIGCKLIDLKTEKELWASDDILSSQYATPVHLDGYLYGIHGREDIPPAHLRCVELASGKIAWSQDDFGVAHAILASDKLLLLTIEGELVLAEASPAKYRELGRAKIARSTSRALPALADGHVYLRDESKLYCVKITDSK